MTAFPRPNSWVGDNAIPLYPCQIHAKPLHVIAQVSGLRLEISLC